ncbi:phosphoglucosamine mutase [Butyrivibrio sp. MC2013]|uniref:phosphoglucosamine mutase n=1 Tax=Butyrivibrio sp. MC2013 TaxID=1280686 RepID=UPI000404F738|nr:phosphoglucosamine mutase [Butyrivibrio sp. MC2013]
MGRYFGTDGFRGEANVGLTADHAYTVGRFLGWYYGELKRQKGDTSAPRIVIGKDTRRSSYMFEYSLVGGLVASGADAYLLHVTTTPSVAYVARVDEFDCGVMITASHNPFYDNGIKLINGNGEKMDEETISLVEDYIDGHLEVFGKKWEEIPFATKDAIGCTVDYVSGRNRYIGYLISLGLYSFKGIKVGLDCANGASWNIAKSVFDALGATTIEMGVEPNGTNINNGVGSTHIENLQKMVVEKGLDIGFAYDGDADRCLCVDENGKVVSGDHILYVYGKYMKDKGELVNNTVVTTVMSNFGLYKAFDEAGIEYAKTAVGDKYVYEYMNEHNCILGGEQSGHIIFSKYATTGDGILTSIKMMEVMLARKKKMSELCSPLVIYPQVLENIRVTDKAAAQNDPEVKAKVESVAKELGKTGRILVRESGTEPVVRVMVEAEDKETCRNLVDSVVNVIKSRGYEA